MAVYFDHHIEAPDSSGAPCEIAWHSSQPVLAVASVSPATGGSVDFYLQQGEHVGNSHVERPFQPTVLHWHPSKMVLAVGWESGEVLLQTYPNGEQTTLPSTHSASITLLEWSTNGSHLITGDQLGVLALWKVDARGRLQGSLQVKHEYGKPLTCGVIRPVPPGEDVAQLARAAVSGDENALDMFNWRKAGKGAPLKLGPKEGLTFFVSTGDGSVHCVDAKGKSSPVLSADGPVQKLLYLEKRDVLVVITQTLLLSQHSVGPEGGTQEITKVEGPAARIRNTK